MKTIEELRSEFEEIKEVKEHIHNVVFDTGCNEYLCKIMGHLPCEFSQWFVNGAWFMFQELKK